MEELPMGLLQGPEIIMILVLALILFGAKKLPELAKGLGHGIKEFRKASREISEELSNSMSEPPPPRHESPSRRYTTPSGVEPQNSNGSQPGEGGELGGMPSPESVSGSDLPVEPRETETAPPVGKS